MNRMPLSLLRRVAVGAVALLPIVLSGCGGSHSSSSSNTPTNDPIVGGPIPATVALISQSETATNGTTTNDTITVNQTGAASYTHAVNSTPNQSGSGSLQSGNGTLSAALTAQFFKDLTAAMPLQNLPLLTGTTSAIAAGKTVQYQGQTGHIDDPNDVREAALASDAAAITQALSIPKN